MLVENILDIRDGRIITKDAGSDQNGNHWITLCRQDLSKRSEHRGSFDGA